MWIYRCLLLNIPHLIFHFWGGWGLVLKYKKESPMVGLSS